MSLFGLSCSNQERSNAPAASARTFGNDRLFDRQAALRYTADFPEESPEAGKLFLDAIDQYRNQKNTRKAKELFLQSLAQYPTSRGYYELGNVCTDRKQYGEAIVSYKMAEALGYQPQSKLLYNMACAYSLQGKPDTARQYLEYAIEAGYSNMEHIVNDPDLAKARIDNEYLFRKVYTDAMSGSSDPAALLWQSFKREFRAAAFPLVLNEQTRTQLGDASFISYDFERFISEMRDTRFSREVGKEFYPLARLEGNERYTALVYAVVEGVMGDDAPVGYVLVSFDGRGGLIDKMHVGGQVEYGGLSKVATIQSNLHFEVKEFKAIYKNDPETAGYYDNPIVRRELQGSKNYRISGNGKFEEARSMLGMR